MDRKKQIYGQVFAIYALTEYYLALQDKDSLDQAMAIFNLLQERAHDVEFKGYYEICSRDWVIGVDSSLGPELPGMLKGMNTSLHVLEAFTNLYRVQPTIEVEQALKEMIEVMIDKVLDQETLHFNLCFGKEWNVIGHDEVSYGHDIEGSWLIYEAAHVLGDRSLLGRAKDIAISMAAVTLNEGVGPDGSVLEEIDEQGPKTTDRTWWPQAEGVVGFWNAYQLTEDERYMEAAIKCWQYIDRVFVDKSNGEWFTRVSEDGVPYRHLAKADAWKCPYHNARACFEVLERL